MSLSSIIRLAAAVVIVATALDHPAAGTTKIYWSRDELPNLQRANTDGSNIDDVILGPTHSLTIDPVQRKLYWIHGEDTEGHTLRRSNLDGTSEQVLDEVPILGSALSENNGCLYMGLSHFEGCFGIWRYCLGGSWAEIVPDRCIWGTAIDDEQDKIYWTDASTAQVLRANLNGSNVEVLIDNAGDPLGIGLDLAEGKMYWNRRSGPIFRANLDGSEVETLVDDDVYKSAIALDLPNGKIYWALEFTNGVYRADLDGSNPESFLGVHAEALAIDPVANGADVPASSRAGRIALLLILLASSATLLCRAPRFR
jgi:hypothetical protein